MQTTKSNIQLTPIVCPGCDLSLAPADPAKNHILLCPRCFQKLKKSKNNSVIKTFAFSLTGLFLYLPALLLPLMTMSILGKETQASIGDATLHLFAQGHYFIGTIVFLTALLLPLYMLFILCMVSYGLLFDKYYKLTPTLFRHYSHITEWAMTDIYLVAILITIIKMGHSAEIHFNTGFFCFVGMVLVTIAAQAALQKKLFWSLLEKKQGLPTKYQRNLVSDSNQRTICHSCDFTIWYKKNEKRATYCPRCGDKLHQRKINSLQRTWALLCTAVILSIPANMLPIMEVEYFGVIKKTTIMDGIIYFFQDGAYGIGLIILTASILVPVFKILGLTIILLTIHFRVPTGLKRKMTMFRFIEFIGRWSMLDIFVIALLSALVQFGFLSTIKTAPAAIYFTCVVLCTMSAAITFDTRLLWNTSENK